MLELVPVNLAFGRTAGRVPADGTGRSDRGVRLRGRQPPASGGMGRTSLPVAISVVPPGPTRLVTYGDSRDPGFFVNPAPDDRIRSASTDDTAGSCAEKVATGGKSRGPGFSRQNSRPVANFRRKCPGRGSRSGHGRLGRGRSGGMAPSAPPERRPSAGPPTAKIDRDTSFTKWRLDKVGSVFALFGTGRLTKCTFSITLVSDSVYYFEPCANWVD